LEDLGGPLLDSNLPVSVPLDLSFPRLDLQPLGLQTGKIEAFVGLKDLHLAVVFLPIRLGGVAAPAAETGYFSLIQMGNLVLPGSRNLVQIYPGVC
jgi:hypothetical protein